MAAGCVGGVGRGLWRHRGGVPRRLAEDQLLRNADKLAGIPGVLVHGRHDMGSPVQTAWELAKAWPDARLHIIEDSGHAGSDTMSQTTRAAIEEFKNL